MTFVAGRKGSGRAGVPGSRLVAGDHGCWFFASPEEHREGVIRFVRQGLESGAKVLYLADAAGLETADGYLRGAGLDPDALLAGRDLVMRSAQAAGGSDPSLDGEAHVALYAQLLEQARDEGYRALWITADRTREVLWHMGHAGLLREEQLVEDFLAARVDALLVCQYDGSGIRELSAHALRSVHNVELAGEELRPLGRKLPPLQVTPMEGGVALSGEVDLSTWPTLRNALSRLSARGDGDVVLDVAGLSFIDTNGMTLIQEAARDLDGSRRLVVRGATPMMFRVAEILGLDREPGLVIRGRRGDGDD